MSIKRNASRKRPFLWRSGLIVLVLLGAFALYLHRLDGASLWRDEALSVIRAEQGFWQIFANRNIVQGKPSPDLHPPFYFLMLHLWQRSVGQTEFAYRLPSVFFMLLALAGFYQIGKAGWSKQTAVFTLLLAIVSPFFYWYAREARMYALVILETVIFYRLLWQVMQPGSRWYHFALLAAAGILLPLTHYTGVFVLAFAIAVLGLLALQQRPYWGRWLVGGVVLGLGGLLLLPHILELLSLPEFYAFSQRQLWVLAKDGINTFSLGSASPLDDPGWRLLPFILLGIVGMVTSFTPKEKRWRLFLLGTGGVLLTLLAFFAASWFKANYSNPRHLTVLTVPWFLLMGHGLSTLWRRQRLVAVLFGLTAVALSGQVLQQTIQAPPMAKDDVRALAAYIAARQQPGDLVLWHDSIMMATYDYYALDLPYTAVPEFGVGDPAIALEELARLNEQYKRIWFVSIPTPTYFEPTLVPNWLAEHRFEVETAVFPASWTSLNLSLLEQAESVAALPANAFRLNLQQSDYQLHGVALQERTHEEGIWVSLYWQTTAPSATPPSACLQLQDSNQTIWSRDCARLTLPKGAVPVSTGYYRQTVWLPLSRGLPPIDYTIAASLEGAFEPIGSMQIPPWETSPPASNLARYPDAGLQLVSLNWLANDFRAGLWALGNLLWYTETAPPPDTAVHIRLADTWGRVIAEQTSSLGSTDHPAGQWTPGSYGQTAVNLALPFTATGRYRVQVQLINEGETLAASKLHLGQWLTVGQVEVGSWPIVTTLPDNSVPLDGVAFGEAISLAGYQLHRRDDQLNVELFWQTTQPLETEYGVFVHVGLPDSAPSAQSSHAPANWLRPTSTWRVGEIVQDSHELMLPLFESEAGLQVLVGLYDLENPNNRLPLTVLGTAVPSNSYILQSLPSASK